MSLFCWTERKIFWRMWETEQFWGTVDFHSIFFSYYGSQWCPKTAWLQTFFKISSFVFGRTKKFIQVWDYLRVSKWWQNFHFWVNYPFNILMIFGTKEKLFWPIQCIVGYCYKYTCATYDCGQGSHLWSVYFVNLPTSVPLWKEFILAPVHI